MFNFNVFRACFSGDESSKATALDVGSEVLELQEPAVGLSSQTLRHGPRPVENDPRSLALSRTRFHDLRAVANSDLLLVRSVRSDPIPMTRARLAMAEHAEQQTEQAIDGMLTRWLDEGVVSVRGDLGEAVRYGRQLDSERFVVGRLLPMSPMSALVAYHSDQARRSLTSSPVASYPSHNDEDSDQQQGAGAFAPTSEAPVFSPDYFDRA